MYLLDRVSSRCVLNIPLCCKPQVPIIVIWIKQINSDCTCKLLTKILIISYSSTIIQSVLHIALCSIFNIIQYTLEDGITGWGHSIIFKYNTYIRHPLCLYIMDASYSTCFIFIMCCVRFSHPFPCNNVQRSAESILQVWKWHRDNQCAELVVSNCHECSKVTDKR